MALSSLSVRLVESGGLLNRDRTFDVFVRSSGRWTSGDGFERVATFAHRQDAVDFVFAFLHES